VWDPPRFDGLREIEEFIEEFEEQVPRELIIEYLYIALKGKPVRWWGKHK
jgi:hypothetical protein